jgi:hypothetical protein
MKTLLITFFLFSSGFALAGSNNGYTTAANVYTGSSSQTWYGGGVVFVLAEWKKEAASPIIEETVSKPEEENVNEAPVQSLSAKERAAEEVSPR